MDKNCQEKTLKRAKSEIASLRGDAGIRAQDLLEPDRRPHQGEDPTAYRAQQGTPTPRRRRRRRLKWDAGIITSCRINRLRECYHRFYCYSSIY